MYKKILLLASAPLTVERPPASLAVMAGVCERNNVEYEVMDLNVFIGKQLGIKRAQHIGNLFITVDKIDHPDADLMAEIEAVLDLAIEKIASFNIDLLAVSSFSYMQIAWTTKFLEKFRANSNVTVIAGGPGISYEQYTTKTAGKVLAENNLIDYYVLGEGDGVFEEFINGIIPLGVNAKDSKYENWVPQIDNLDNLPTPSYKKFDISNYTSDIMSGATQITITGSRGCVRRCTFCDVGYLWKKFRFRSADSIVTEIVTHFKEVGCLHYFFSDSLINGSLKQFMDVMTKLIALHNEYPELKQLSYSGQFIIRPKIHHKEKMFELLQQSGCDHLEIGIESGSEKVREHIGKKFSNDDIDYHLEMCEKYKIKNHILMFTSYPTETLEDHQETLDFYIKNQKYLINGTIFGTNINTPAAILSNTPLEKMSDELGIEFTNKEAINVSNWTISTNPKLTVVEKWRRYIELVRLTAALRYPRPFNLDTWLELNIQDFEKFSKSD